MAEAVSAQMQVAQAVLAVERAPLPEPELTVESAPDREHIPPQQTARQLTMADLFQRHGAQPTKQHRCTSRRVVAQQLSLFEGQSAAVQVNTFPCFRYEKDDQIELLWGATYRITAAFLDDVFDFVPPDPSSLPEIHGSLSKSYLSNN